MGFGSAAVDRVRAWRVQLEMKQPFSSARSQIRDRQVVLIRIEAGGNHGWGEAAPVPGHSRESIAEIWSNLRSAVADRGVDAHQLVTGMLHAAFSQAKDDLTAREAGLPLWSLLGGSRRVAASAAIGTDPGGQPDVLQITSAAQSGYLHMKLKITPQTDADRVAAVISEHPDVAFGVDANGSLGMTELPLLLRLDGLGLEYIEQPGPAGDLDLHVRLCRQLATPICLDESARSAPDIDRIVARGAADIVNLKAGRFGTRATLQIASDLAAAATKARLGGLIESGIGRAHTAALAAHPLFSVVGDIAASDRYFEDDLVRPQWRLDNGYLPLPDNPGIGVTVAESAVAAAALDAVATN